MSRRRDPYFGRFVVTVSVVGVIIIVLGLAGIWYYFQPGGGAASGGVRDRLPAAAGANRLPPTKAMLYYTRDGRTLTSTIAEIGPPGTSPTDRARVIMERLVEGRDRAQLVSPIPQGTRVNAVFVDDGVVIVNLSREFMNNLRGGVEAEMLAVSSVVNSLMHNMDNVRAVQILIDGATVPTLNGNVDIGGHLIANSAIVRAG